MGYYDIEGGPLDDSTGIGELLEEAAMFDFVNVGRGVGKDTAKTGTQTSIYQMSEFLKVVGVLRTLGVYGEYKWIMRFLFS